MEDRPDIEKHGIVPNYNLNTNKEMELIYNLPESSKERSEVIPLSVVEMKEVVETLNEKLKKASYDEKLLIQRFIWNYENLDHHKSCTVGLYATDQPHKFEDPEGLLFQIRF